MVGYSKNQWFADTYPAPLSSLDVQVNGSASDPVVSVTVYRKFTDGTSQARSTYVLIEDGVWKHRFSAEEIELYMPEASYDEFVAAQQGSSSSTASATPTATATATATATPSPNRNNNVPNAKAPGRMSRAACISKGGHLITPGTDGDGDDDGCTGE